ncbi:hypothetical protein ACFTAO_27890 [Paenibacillus rhizoplanae]
MATATDIFKVTITSNAPESYALGTTEVTWTATDANGNVSTGVQKITVVDTTKPVLKLPADKTVEATALKNSGGDRCGNGYGYFQGNNNQQRP